MSDQWNTVSDGEVEQETKIVFEAIGDQFIGEYLGLRELVDRETGNKYYQARFKDEDGDICFTRANWSLKEGLDKVRIGSKTRVTYVDDIDTGRASPMRSFKVETAGSAAVSEGNTVTARPVKRATSRASKPASGAEAKS